MLIVYIQIYYTCYFMLPSSVGLLFITSGLSTKTLLTAKTLPGSGELRSDAALTLSTAPKYSIRWIALKACTCTTCVLIITTENKTLV